MERSGIMLQQLWHKIKEALVSVLPVTLIVIILNFTPLIDLSTYEIIVFSVSALLLILGIGLFNLGADLSMQPMGEQVGAALMKSKKIPIIILVCFLMGLFITIAEPDLSVLGSQVSAVINPTLLIWSVGIGVGLFLVLAILKIVFKKDLSMMLMFFYMMMFAFSCLVILSGNEEFLALSFDSGGVTTGPITVPFIMALGVGVAINAILNPIFLYVANMGIEGVAWATVIGQFVSFVLTAIYFFKTKTFKLKIKDFVPNFKAFKTAMILGLNSINSF
jgi:Na+-driven multidrug efflux pump